MGFDSRQDYYTAFRRILGQFGLLLKENVDGSPEDRSWNVQLLTFSPCGAQLKVHEEISLFMIHLTTLSAADIV